MPRDRGSRPRICRNVDRVIREFACMPGPAGFLGSRWFSVDCGPVTEGDISCWPFSVPLLVKFTSFLSTLQWPEGLNEMGMCGVSYVEILILFEMWVGHRLLPEKTVPKPWTAGRSFKVGVAPVSDGVRIRIGCQR